jgi:hypothetical protein
MYIVLETFWQDNICIITDEQGDTKLFDTKEEAEKEAKELQQGLVVEVHPKA